MTSMSEPKDLQRYEAVIPWEGEMQPHGDGEYVRYDDIAPFVADLRTQLAAAREAADQWEEECSAFGRENENLRERAESAERERDAYKQRLFQTQRVLWGDTSDELGGYAAWETALLQTAASRHRAERMGAVVEAVRAFMITPSPNDDELCAMGDALRALDALDTVHGVGSKGYVW